MSTDTDDAALKAKIDAHVRACSVLAAMAGFGLGGILGTLSVGVLAGIALSVFCAPLGYVAFVLAAAARPSLVVPKRWRGEQ